MKKLFLILFALVATLTVSAKGGWQLVKGIDYSTSSWSGWNNADFPRKDGAMVVTNEAKKEANYMLQYHGLDGISIEDGTKYKVEITVQGDGEGAIYCSVYNWGVDGKNGTNIKFNTEKQTLGYEFTSGFSNANCFVMMQSGDYVGTYKVYKVEVYKWVEKFLDIKSFEVDATAATHVAKVFNNQFSNVSDADGEITVVSPAKAEQDWDSQFWFVMKEPLAADAQVVLTFDAKASSAQTLGFGAHGKPDGNNWEAGGVCEAVNLTTEWQSFTRTINAKAEWQSFALDLTKATEVTYNFKNIKLLIKGARIALGNAAELGELPFGVTEGIKITFPDNNVEDFAGSAFAGKLLCDMARLYKGMNLVKEVTDVTGTATSLSLFAGEDLEQACEYSIQIPAMALTLNDEQGCYWTNDKKIQLDFTIARDPSLRQYFTAEEANTTIFDLNKATGYDKNAATINGGWTFEEPQDLGDWQWLVVVASRNAQEGSRKVTLTDAAGKSIGGDDYDKGGNTSRANMWLDKWNNQNCLAINLKYFKENGILDITQIKSLTFGAGAPVSAVYLTNYKEGKAVSTTGGTNVAGDYVRDEENAYGIIALRYAAAVSGASVYTVSGFDAAQGLYLTPYYGVLKAGIPYIYKANDSFGKKVNFYRVDGKAITSDWSDNASDNGLIGTYDGGFWPGYDAIKDSYILLEDGIVLSQKVAAPQDWSKNRGFFDPTKCKNNVKDGVLLPIHVTEINLTVNNALTLSSEYILNLNGLENVEAYVAKGITVNKVNMVKVEGAIPANTGVVLVGNGEVTIPVVKTASVDVTGNLLVATTEATQVPAGAYVLAGKGEQFGWYLVGETIPTLAAGKCYLKAPEAAGARVLTMAFEDNDATAIEEVENKAQQKVYYNLQGVRVAHPKAGMYIVNGKKVIINK